LATEREAAPHVAPVERLARGEEPAAGAAVAAHIPGRERSEVAIRLLVYLLMILIAIVFFMPFLWSFTTSLKTLPESVAAGFDLIPNNPSFDAYDQALTAFNFRRYMVNSAIVATAVTITNLILASIGGYAFARLRFPGREVLFLLVLATLMIPDQLRLVPIFTLLADFPHTAWNPDWPPFHWNLIGTYHGYILVGGGGIVSATNLFLMRQYFLTIPRDYEEAAKLDGAGYFKTYWRVMLPLAGPALAAVTILTFQGTWNDFFWQLLILQDPDKFTIPVGISNFVGEFKTNWPPLMAASILAILPIAAIYVFFQRYFIAGVTAAGVKG
jgi:multiple sugar transport system permease protein